RQPPARSMAELQFQLDAFREYYNNRRPHRALDRQTPLAVFNSRIKSRPSLQPAPLDHRVRRDKIDSFGKVTLRYLASLRHIPGRPRTDFSQRSAEYLRTMQAPGGPGAPPSWGPGRKQGFGTAPGLQSKVWFTIAGGALSDCFYPTLDRPALTRLRFIVAAP